MNKFFNHKSGVTLLGAGNSTKLSLNVALNFAPHFYCVDGGANISPRSPLAVIGDLDSIDKNGKYVQGVRMVLMDDQNTTDFDKALSIIDAPFFICVGFLGGRLDHQCATFSSVAKFMAKKIILITENELCFLLPPCFYLNCDENILLSLFPLTSAQGVSRGLKWPIDGLFLSPDQQISISNQTQSNKLMLSLDYGKVLAINAIDTACKSYQGPNKRAN